MYRVAISAGHNPAAPGAARHGVTEHQEAVEWVDQLISAITLYGDRDRKLEVMAHKIPTGTLGAKVRHINNLQCDLALEIHFNAASDNRASGCETLYFPGSEKGRGAALAFQTDLSTAMETKSRGVKEGWYRMVTGGVPNYFLAKTNCTALILEPEFLEHISKIKRLRSLGCWSIATSIYLLAQGVRGLVEHPAPPTSEAQT